jgi:phenylacetic acid degradation operon negative regulatory protein
VSVLSLMLAALRARPWQTASILVSLFGDAIAPRGGEAPLTLLADVLGGFGIDHVAVRKATSRLVAEGWLERRRHGRRSFFRLAPEGHETFAAAAAHIYGPAPPVLNGFRLAVLPPDGPRAIPPALRAAGWAWLAPGVLIAPAAAEWPLPERALRMAAEAAGGAARAIATRVWPLDEIAGRYDAFIADFEPAAEALKRETPAGIDALRARLLVLHQYRRAVLRDPKLPVTILPANWPGHHARTLCAEIYLRLVGPAEAWLDTTGLPPAMNPVTSRFADLDFAAIRDRNS